MFESVFGSEHGNTKTFCRHEVAQVVSNKRIDLGIRRDLQHHFIRWVAELWSPLVVRRYRLKQPGQLIQDRIYIIDLQARRRHLVCSFENILIFQK